MSEATSDEKHFPSRAVRRETGFADATRRLPPLSSDGQYMAGYRLGERLRSEGVEAASPSAPGQGETSASVEGVA